MKQLNINRVVETNSRVRSMVVEFVSSKKDGQPDISRILIQLSKPIDDRSSMRFVPGDPGFDDLEKGIKVDKALGDALAVRIPSATIEDIPTDTEITAE